ncbi:putative transcriptional regulator [Candidatus Methanoperedens nitroreducens]|uniref:Putative transcriptional regulator n=1 Tax=Candidatus Methanoperedens nitratireducens TaxID=1392998 RepID=A0A062V125_9EURY|nr:metalloregulator ArsR/SmtB family transcription factor [Candidatus Methanoperedens nitroreducens]KCZ71087.1 putative transcriptional regulator [Candidatus Methanoperedens nitroreducens]MDJ1421540.1 metalloregulator ArsR/SmtB family transcription factor [Candidatus Methanoperedens sp.]
MNNKCLCESRTIEPCCPGDAKLRREWLLNLEKEHESLRYASEEITRKLRIFSSPDRVEILLMLDRREHCMDEIARKLKARKPAISYHLELLKRHGMICIRKRSRFAFYCLSHEGKKAVMLFQNI